MVANGVADSIDVQLDLRVLIADLKAQLAEAREAGQSAAVATLSDKLLRAYEIYEKNQGTFGTRESVTINQRQQKIEAVIAGWDEDFKAKKLAELEQVE